MREQYIDIMNKVLSETDYQYADLYREDDETFVLILESTDSVKPLNEAFRNVLKENKIDTYPDYTYDTYYIEFVSGDNWGFSDEFYICSECNKAIRTTDGYAHIKVWIGDGFCMCEDCVRANASDYIEDLTNDYTRANLILSENELNGLGFYKQNEEHYASGLYHRHDNPKQIFEKIRETNPDVDILFSINENYNPYEEEFDVYIKEK